MSGRKQRGRNLLLGLALIIIIPMVFMGTAGQHNYTIIVTDTAELSTVDWSITLTAYLQEGQVPRVDIGANDTTISAFTGDSVALEKLAYVKAVEHNETLSAFMVEVSMPLHENALFQTERVRASVDELNHRFTDHDEIDITIRSEDGFVHVTGMGNDFVCLDEFYLPLTDEYSLSLSLDGEQSIIYLLGMNTLGGDININIYNATEE